MASLDELRKRIESLYPDAVYSMLSYDSKSVAKVQYTEGTSEETKAAVQAVIDGYDWNALPPDLDKFNALFLQGYIENVFTQSQLIDAQLAQKITNEQYRNAWLRGLIANGSPEQQARLFDIAQECNIPLPQL